MRFPILLAALLALLPMAHAQQATMSRFLRLARSGGDVKPLLAGEALSRGVLKGSLAPSADETIMISPNSVAVRVQRQDAYGKPIKDVYFYLDRIAGSWKIVSSRALAVPALLNTLRDQLKAMPKRTPEQTAMLRNLELTLLSNRELRSYFETHRPMLERLAARVKPHVTKTIDLESMNDRQMEAAIRSGALARNPADPKLQRDLKAIGFERADREKDIVQLTIGGMQDDEVGFLKVLKGKPPVINPETWIWIEPLGNGWYLFKTT